MDTLCCRELRRILTICVLLLCAGCPTPPPAPPRAEKRIGAAKEVRPPACALRPSASNFKVYAIGTYAGLEPLDRPLEASGKPASRAEVVVSDEAQPVVLVLMSHEPTAWHIGRTKKAAIAGLLVSGRHKNAVTGIAMNVPLLVLAGENRQQQAACAPFYAYQAGPGLLEANKAVKRYVGREIDHFVIKAQDGVFFAGPPGPVPKSELVYATDRELPAPAPASPPGAAPARNPNEELARLEQAGALRLARAEEIKSWEEGASAVYTRFNKDLRVRHTMVAGETYVVVRPFKLPPGLLGENARSFIIPKGVKAPAGDRGESVYYFMEGFRCTKRGGKPCQ